MSGGGVALAPQVGVWVDPSLSPDQFDAFKSRLITYMSTEGRNDWLQPPNPFVYMGDVGVRTAPQRVLVGCATDNEACRVGGRRTTARCR